MLMFINAKVEAIVVVVVVVAIVVAAVVCPLSAVICTSSISARPCHASVATQRVPSVGPSGNCWHIPWLIVK